MVLNDETTQVGQNRSESVAKNEIIQIGENRQQTVGGYQVTQVGDDILIQSLTGDISLGTAAGNITLTHSGEVFINGKSVNVVGTEAIHLNPPGGAGKTGKVEAQPIDESIWDKTKNSSGDTILNYAVLAEVMCFQNFRVQKFKIINHCVPRFKDLLLFYVKNLKEQILFNHKLERSTLTMKSIILTLLFSVYISLIACGSAESNIEPLEISDIEAVMLEGAKEMLQARMDSLSEEDLNATLDAGMGPE